MNELIESEQMAVVRVVTTNVSITFLQTVKIQVGLIRSRRRHLKCGQFMREYELI